MAQQASKTALAREAQREVIPLDDGMVAYGPTRSGGYWRLRWVELGRRHDTTARSRAEALAKAAELSERLNIGVPTSKLRAKGVIRAWARGNNIEVPDRGRLKPDVLQAWEAAGKPGA